MSPQPPSASSPIGPTTIRERCQALGMPTWRLDTSGTVLEEPVEPGTTGLWLRSSVITARIAEATRRLGGQIDPDLIELFPGCWVVVLTERRRRLRVSYVFALALSKEGLEHKEFADACRSAQLDPAAAKRSLASVARFDLASASNMAGALHWMVDDLVRLRQNEDAVGDFTRQLTDSFETIDLLYSLGRSMHDLKQPESFAQFVCDRLHASLSFGWVAACFRADDAASPGVSGKLYIAGEPPIPGVQLIAGLRKADTTRQHIVAELPGMDEPIGGQVVLQPIGCAGRASGVLAVGDKHGDDPHVSSYDLRLLEAAATYVGAFMENAALYSAQERLFLGTVESLTAAIDAKDPYTCGHSRRVATLAAQLASALGMQADDVERVRVAGLVHDVGKIGIPEGVLTKQGRLTDEEFDLIKQHPVIGYRILKDIALLKEVLPGVLYHHERFDGRGYPRGLAGGEIPLIARILALADTFDAMSSSRSYRPAVPRDKILEELRRNCGTQFDPELLPVFLAMPFAQYDLMLAERSAQIFAKAA